MICRLRRVAARDCQQELPFQARTIALTCSRRESTRLTGGDRAFYGAAGVVVVLAAALLDK